MGFPASSPAALDLVPPEHLEPPPGDEPRYLVRDECALLLDGYLRRLARQAALGRDVPGSLARAFLGQRGQHALRSPGSGTMRGSVSASPRASSSRSPGRARVAPQSRASFPPR